MIYFRRLLLACILLLNFGAFAAGTAPGFLWATAVHSGGTPNGDEGADISVDSAGNAYVTGNLTSTATFDGGTLTNSGGYQLFVLKYGPGGQYQWAHQIAGGVGTESRITSDRAGNAYLFGQFQGTASFESFSLTNSGETSIFVAKYDSSGKLLWARQSNGDSCYAWDITTDPTGDVLLSGILRGNMSFGGTNWASSQPSSDVFLTRLDPSGNLVWFRQAKGTNLTGPVIASDPAGNSYLGGVFQGTIRVGNTTLISTQTDRPDAFIAKFDSDGNAVWAKNGGQLNDLVRAIAADSFGNTYLVSDFYRTISFGSLTLKNTGSTEFADFVLAKYDANGNFAWARQVAGPGDDHARALATDSAGNVYLTGSFGAYAATAAFGDTNIWLGNYGPELFVAKYGPNGDLDWATAARGRYAVGRGIAVDVDDTCLLTGWSAGTNLFGEIIAAGGSDTYARVFTAKLASQLSASPPVIIARPGDQTVYEGEPILLSVTATGAGPLTYQWQLNGTNIPGAITPTYLIDTALADNSGAYRVVVSNPLGAATSAVARVCVEPPAGMPEYLWARREGGSSGDFATAIATDDSGNVFVTGSFFGTTYLGNIRLHYFGADTFTDIFVAKYDRAGTFLWVRQIGTVFDDYPVSIATDTNGNALLAGKLGSTTTLGGTTFTNGGFFLAKYDPDGALLWARIVPGTITGLAVAQTGDSLVAGWFYGFADFGVTNLAGASTDDIDIFVARYNPLGDLNWARQAGGILQDRSAVVVAAAGRSFYIAGSVSNTNAAFGAIRFAGSGGFLARYDDDGNAVWVREAAVGDLAVDVAQNVYLSGAAALTKYDSNAQMTWSRPLAGPWRIAVDSGAKVFVAGWFSRSLQLGDRLLDSKSGSLFVAAFDHTGNLVAVRQTSGSSNVRFGGICADPDDQIFLTGSFGGAGTPETPYDTLAFGNGTLQNAGAQDIFLAKLAALPPSLDLVRDADKVLLSWAARRDKFVLESNIQVPAPNSWEIVAGVVRTNAIRNTKWVPFSAGERFFRLRQL